MMSIIKNLFNKSFSVFNVRKSRIQFFESVKGDAVTHIQDQWAIRLKEFGEIKEAYFILAKIRKNDPPNPTICLYPKSSRPRKIVERLSIDIKDHFSADVYIDILFLENAMRVECKHKSEPFYKKEDSK